jgi:uncharacterized protein (TIGR03084 family)
VADLEGVLTDLRDEGDELDALVALLPDWSAPSAAAGWTIGHQIGHLAWTDDVALLAATDAAGFAARLQELLAGGGLDTYVDRAAEQWRARPDLLAAWRAGRMALAKALRAVPPGTKLPWFGPPMSPTSMATARLMETWAHGQDVADALGAARPVTARIRHVAHLGVRTRDFAFRLHGLEPPADEFRVELAGPSGEMWTWGPADAAQRVTGPALDFCLLVTQRRHRADLALAAAGPDAERWLEIAQAFAGPPGAGREPGAAG